MGTRSIIMIKNTDKQGKTTVHRLYKHCGGYPTDNLKMIHYALLKGKNTLDGFIKHCEAYYKKGMVEETFHNDTFNVGMLGCQGDLEWIYTVDLNKKFIKVFGGGYTGETPDFAYNKGTINPLTYVNNLIYEYQNTEKTRILEALYNLKTIGYIVNQKNPYK